MRGLIPGEILLLSILICGLSSDCVHAEPFAIMDYLGPSGELSGYYHTDDGVVQNYVIGGMTQKYQSIALPFWIWTDEDVYLTGIEAGLQRMAYDGDLRVRIVSDAGSSPGGTIIEELAPQTPIGSTAVYTFEASGTTRLTSGYRYWIVAVADYPGKFAWHQPAEGGGCSEYLINRGSGWETGPWNGNLAVRINATLVPEPAMISLLALGWFALIRRRIGIRW